MSSTFSPSTITRARNLIATVFVVSLLTNCSYAKQHLTTHFYSKTCPKLFSTVHQIVQSVVHKENRMGASLLRLHFHDCFVQGCDGSILLDDTASFKGEKGAHVNKNSVRGFEIIDEIKSAVEKVCPGVVSCADIIAIAARDSVVQLGCKMWNVKLGRRDSRTANLYAANNGAIPSHSSNLSALISAFSKVGLSSKDLVALSGAHTLGSARCANFRSRIYNDKSMNRNLAITRQKTCPKNLGSGENNLAPLDLHTPHVFDNKYYTNLINKEGLLYTCNELYTGGSTNSLVEEYSQNETKFQSDFIAAMIKMGNINVLTGSKGEVRKNCRLTNYK
ncbi:unnamed protein product [Cuscuta epithymum]|uniref:Peroxidase n=1 Tax=Cuscuta epithymum TaxID=186058 RepID=A0AAV0CEG1_9ASTE|nr:unnamed protein product [Cuscuta epithymum]